MPKFQFGEKPKLPLEIIGVYKENREGDDERRVLYEAQLPSGISEIKIGINPANGGQSLIFLQSEVDDVAEAGPSS